MFKKKHFPVVSFSPVAFTFVLLCISAGILNAGNAVPNPSFENIENEKPAGWIKAGWSGKGVRGIAEAGHTGSRCVVTSSEKGGDIAWQATVAVKPFSQYKLSGWIKTENVKPVASSPGRGAQFNLHNLQGVRTPAVQGTKGWTKVEVLFETAETDSVLVNCLFGGWGLATGRAWFDDVAIELLNSKTMQPDITIDAEKTREPLSKYIYSQFIEHLGRCIYGGIWAEMLEDRKFWYPVSHKNSPWDIAGKAANVAMVKKNSFVGEHTPEIQAGDGPAGLVQNGLGLIKGKKYVGRVVLSGSPSACPVEVTLAWGNEPHQCKTVAIRKLAGSYRTVTFSFTSGGTTNKGSLSIVGCGKGKGCFRIGTASLMPGDNVHGMRADTLTLLKELDAPLYRWPGGNFVSGYDWRDGIGDRDLRPPRKNPAWRGVEHNDFGIDDFLLFCRIVNAEPLVVVNTGLGRVDNAVKELMYTNSDANTSMGRLRAENGHPEPYNVKWWGIGNEMYGGWQLGHMPLEKYIKKHNRFVDAMRSVDSGIKVVAVGATGRWSEGMMAECADHMDLVSEHFYCQHRQGLLSHVNQIPNAIRHKAESHRRYRKTIDALKGKDIRIAMDEWNYWYGPHLYGELGVRYFLKDALGIAAGINEYSRHTDIIYMANYAQTVNVIGCIKTNKTEAEFATTGLVLKMYRKHFGTIPVSVGGETGLLNIAAALTEDKHHLTVSLINPTKSKVEIPVTFSGVRTNGTGTMFSITGPNAMAYNAPGENAQVTIKKDKVKGIENRMEAAPISITLYKLKIQQE